KVIEIEPGGSIIGEGVGIVLFLKAAGRVERDVVIDELAEVGVTRADPAVFLIVRLRFRCRGSIGCGGHRLRELFEGGNVGLGEVGRRQTAKHAAEAAFEQCGSASAVEATKFAVFAKCTRHGRWNGRCRHRYPSWMGG